MYKRQAQGDLSENFEYYAAKKEKNQNESRIRYVERMLKTAVVISEESKEDEVGLNNTVTPVSYTHLVVFVNGLMTGFWIIFFAF